MSKEDIRIIKHICDLSDGVNGWQKELNIISKNNGPFEYDIREWSLDHSTFRNGISLSNDEARIVLAFLKECINDEGITIDTVEVPLVRPSVTTTEIDNTAIEILKEAGIEFVDKRANGGALWVIGGHELDEIMQRLADAGQKFFFSEKGGRVTKNKPGWYLRAPKAV